MGRAFAQMGNHEVAAALRVLFERGEAELIREGFMPEADVFLCRWRGKQFNVKLDLIYGPDLYFLDPIAPQERTELEALIESAEP